MEPIGFKYQNKVLLPGMRQYSGNVDGVSSLPVWTDYEQCVSCWRMSWRERLAALLFGRCWIAVLSGGTQPPICATITREYLRETDEMEAR